MSQIAAPYAAFLLLMKKNGLRGCGYGICKPLMLRATTNRWISDVPSKIV
jgi:hypothetical protein